MHKTEIVYECLGATCLGDLAHATLPGARRFASSDCLVVFSGWLGPDPAKTLKSWGPKLWEHAEAGGSVVLFAPLGDADIFRGDRTVGYIYGTSLFEFTDKRNGFTLLTTSILIKQKYAELIS